MEERQPRKLAVILHADVVGSTALVQRNESVAHERMQDAFRRFSTTIESYGGIAHEIRGDALVAEFARASDAVSAALAFQFANEDHNKGVTDDIRPELRIGISLGEVVIADGTITGLGVVLAQRLEQLAESGGICIQGAAYETVPQRLPVKYESLGEQEVKGFQEPVRVYRVSLEDGQAIPAPDPAVRPDMPALELPDKPSIAVLPFANMSGDPEQEYLSDGITEDIITELSKFRWFFVIARNSTFTFKGRAVSIEQVAKELGVRYVLEGSVRTAGRRVRISAQLIDAATGNHVWAERYDRELADIFDLQDEITETIVGAIEPELGGAERTRAKRKPPESLDAWQSYQRGLWHLWRKTKSDAREAEKLLQSAIEMDSGFGTAYSSLAYLYFDHVVFGWTNSPDETLSRGLQAGQQALFLDNKDPFAHFALGRIHTMQGELEPAIAELETALDLNPNLALAYHGLGFALLWSGRPREALPHFIKAIRQSPHDPLRWGFEMFMGIAHIYLSEHENAVELLRSAARHPDSGFWPRAAIAMAYFELDLLDDAHSAMDAAVRLRPDLSVTAFATMVPSLNSVYKDRFLDALREIGLPE